MRLPRRLRDDGIRVRFEPRVAPEAQRAADPVAAVDQRLALAYACRSLHPRARRLLALCYFADLSQAQAAAALGMSRAQASRVLHEALGTLRRVLSDPASSATTGEPAVASAGGRG
jgi:RNA polymerase sigma factor (sigma-70 family)